MTCTTLDHVYPVAASVGATQVGTPCYCGARTWGGGKRIARRLKVGAVVRVGGEQRTVVAKARGDDDYKVDAPVSGRQWFERSELEAI